MCICVYIYIYICNKGILGPFLCDSASIFDTDSPRYCNKVVVVRDPQASPEKP